MAQFNGGGISGVSTAAIKSVAEGHGARKVRMFVLLHEAKTGHIFCTFATQSGGSILVG
jgi:hypothetical protein